MYSIVRRTRNLLRKDVRAVKLVASLMAALWPLPIAALSSLILQIENSGEMLTHCTGEKRINYKSYMNFWQNHCGIPLSLIIMGCD